MRRLQVLALAFAMVGVSSASAQQSPFLPDPVYRVLVNEVSGDISNEHVRWFTHWHRPTAGSEGFEAVAKYIERRPASTASRTCAASTSSRTPWPGRSTPPSCAWSQPFERRLAYSPEVQLSVADGSRSADIKSAELVDVGEATSEKDYAGKAIEGKVRADDAARIFVAMSEAVWKRGALGVVGDLDRARDRLSRPARLDADARREPGRREARRPSASSCRRARGSGCAASWPSSKAPIKVSVKIDVDLHRAAVPVVRRGGHPRHRDPRPGHRADRSHPGGALLGERRRERAGERAGDRPRAEEGDRRGTAAAAGPRHPLLVVRRDRRRGAVLRHCTRTSGGRSSRTSTRTWSAPCSRPAAACSSSPASPGRAPASSATSSNRS